MYESYEAVKALTTESGASIEETEKSISNRSSLLFSEMNDIMTP